MLDGIQLLRLLLSAYLVRLLLILGYVDTARHKHEIETLDFLQVSRHSLIFHLVLEAEPVGKLVFLLACAYAWTAAADPD